jgi:TonB-linked SusC/RagA family outer membrane protein
MKKNYLLIVFALICSIPLALAQRTITGTVTDDKNAPLFGASVVVTGTTIGSLADADGKFSLSVPADAKTLTASFVGYVSKIITLGSENNLTIALAEGNALQELVVVGYTTQRKEDLTGSIAVVELNPVKNNSSGNVMQALQGRVAGLYIEKDGSPNGSNSRILIRGANTLGNNNPLYIIDGIPTVRPEVFQNLNPATIESVQVLKDASSESIYGSRASNGVIIVTTKNGGDTNGKIAFQFNSSFSTQSEKSQRFKMLDAVGRGKALWQASVNDGQDPAAGYGEIYDFNWNKDFKNPVLNSVSVKPFVGGDVNTPVGNTDWQDVMYKTGAVTKNDFTASFGTKNSSVEINLGQLKNTGMLQFTNYDRLSGGISALTRAFDDKVRFGANFRIASSNERLGVSDLGGEATTTLAYTLAPTIPVYQKDGITYAGASGAGYSDRNNPLHMQDINKWNNTNRLNTFANTFLEIQPIKNLFFKSNVGADNSNYLGKVITQAFSEGAFNRTSNSLAFDQNHYLSLTWSNTARYNLDLNDNHFKFLAGLEYIKTDLDFQYTKKEGFAVQTEDYFTLNAATGNTTVAGGSTGNRLYSQFGRVDYNFSDKYLAAVTIRRDGSSRFGPENQYGIFPAVSVGWRLDKEAFMANQKLFSELKVRVGVGRVGNQEIGNLARFGLFDTRYGTALSQLVGGFWEQYMNVGTAYALNGANTGTLPSGFVQTQAANPALKWETTDETNAGIDFALLNNHVFGSFDYFTRQTSDILITPPVASALGEGQSKAVNGAAKSNKGWELVLGYRGEANNTIKYNIVGNFAHFRDAITDLPENVRPAYPGNLVSTIIGHSQFDIFGYKTSGLFQNQAEVDAAAKQVGAAPGRIRYVDINGDGKINDLDRTWIGTTLPALEYGIRIDVSYKNFDFAAFGSGVTGRTGIDPYSYYNNFIRGRENVGPNVLNGWSSTNTGSKVPALTLADNNNETRISDYFIVNTSYFKMRSLQLGYSIMPKAVFTKLRFYVMGDNLFWFKSSAFVGPDPERSNPNSGRADTGPNNVTRAIPIPTTLSFGINASF